MANVNCTHLYEAALEADFNFERELLRAYGEAAVADARYKMVHADAAVTAAKAAKVAADAAWWKAAGPRGHAARECTRRECRA